MCSRLKLLPPASKSTASKPVISSPPSPDLALLSSANSSTGRHRALLHEAGLSPDVVGLLPEPALIVEILSEIVLHKDASSNSVDAILSIAATLLHRCFRSSTAVALRALTAAPQECSSCRGLQLPASLVSLFGARSELGRTAVLTPSCVVCFCLGAFIIVRLRDFCRAQTTVSLCCVLTA